MLINIINAGIFASIALSGFSSAHLIMKTPVPFSPDTLNNSPLVDAAIGSSTSDFPCKKRANMYNIKEMNKMPVGENQTLSFTGSASHGGGTCQLAVSLDKEPTASSIWKLIQVYEGGCPITAEGNGMTTTFPFSIPEKFPNGQATLAWTWFNRIGNREIYMNCAPIEVSGGSDNQDYYNTLPNMYVINLPSSQCSSVEGTNQLIPNPGQFVAKADSADKVAEATGPACAAAAAAQTNGVSGYQAAASDNGAGQAAASTQAAIPSQTANNGQYQPQATTQAPAATSAAPVASGMTTMVSSVLSLAVVAPTSAAALPASPTSTVAAAPTGGQSGSNTNGSTTPATAQGTTCSPDGAVVCNGESQFGLCNWGQVVWQNVAAGTTCQNGVISRKLVRKDSVHFRAHFGNAHS